MKKIKLFFTTTLLASVFIISNSCSQATAKSETSVFVATTPCNDATKRLLGIPADYKCEMMRWELKLYSDGSAPNPAIYKLSCTYGMSKQGSRGFSDGAKTIELKGKCAIEKGTNENTSAKVYKLTADDSPIVLSFAQPDQNLLHLLDDQKHLMVGTGAWSYTLSRIEPANLTSSNNILNATSPLKIKTDSLIVGIFFGRTPCNNDLTSLHGIAMNGCQGIKCKLTLYQDVKTHQPSTFQLYTIYVGKGDDKYSITGKWKMVKGTKTDPNAIVYQLEPDTGGTSSILFMFADDNTLFFLNKDGNFLVGNEYLTYTLSRSMK